MPDVLLTFVHISDTHIHPDPDYSREYADITSYVGAKALVDEINNLPFTPDFVLHTGDVAYDPNPEAYAACHDILSEIRFPVYYVAGNHDTSAALQQYLMKKNEPVIPLHYVFEVNGVQFICVDSNGSAAEPPAGYVTEYQLGWLKGLCEAKDSRPLVIAIHHNPLQTGIPWLDDYMGIQNGDAFHQAILPARERIRGVFHGHVHQNIDVMRDGILYSSCLSSWVQYHAYPGMTETTPDPHAEPGYSIVQISHNQTYIRRCRFALPKG